LRATSLRSASLKPTSPRKCSTRDPTGRHGRRAARGPHDHRRLGGGASAHVLRDRVGVHLLESLSVLQIAEEKPGPVRRAPRLDGRQATVDVRRDGRDGWFIQPVGHALLDGPLTDASKVPFSTSRVAAEGLLAPELQQRLVPVPRGAG
jgi:hypothetical protein